MMTSLAWLTIPRIDITVKLCGLAAALFGIWKYFDEVDVKRKGTSLAVFQEMSQGQVLASRMAIGASLHALKRIANEKEKNSEDRETGSVDLSLYFDPAKEALMGPLRMDYGIVIGYFERARLCIVSGQCHEETLKSLLKQEAASEMRNLWPYLEEHIALEVANGNSDFALGIICFAQVAGQYERASNLCFEEA